MITAPPVPGHVCNVIGALRCDLSDEKATQAQIAEGLTRAGVPFERERRLSGRDVIDFLVGDDIGVEVKLRSTPKRAVYKQLQRYTSHDVIRSLILVTNLSMGLPERIGGKPAYFVSLGQAWL
jgi:hypothetical protein